MMRYQEAWSVKIAERAAALSGRGVHWHVQLCVHLATCSKVGKM